MADATPIHISALDLAAAGTQVAGHLQTASIAPLHALPTPVAASPVDVAAGGAVTALQTKMTAMQGHLSAKSGELQTTTDTSAAAMQAQDASNASPLKDLASSIPSGGSNGGNGGHVNGGNYSPGEGKVSAVDSHTFKADGGTSGPHQCSDKDEWKYTAELIGGAGSIAAMISNPPGWVAGLTAGPLAVAALLDGLDGLDCAP